MQTNRWTFIIDDKEANNALKDHLRQRAFKYKYIYLIFLVVMLIICGIDL
jgi:hypothetical protein